MSVSRWRSQYARYLKLHGREPGALSFSEFLVRKHDQDAKHAGRGKSSRRRIAKRISRRSVTKIQKSVWNGSGKRRKVLTEVSLLTYKSKADALRDTICPSYDSEWLPVGSRLRDRSVTHVSVTEFSLARNPDGVLRKLREIAAACARCPDVRLDFMDQQVEDGPPPSPGN